MGDGLEGLEGPVSVLPALIAGQNLQMARKRHLPVRFDAHQDRMRIYGGHPQREGPANTFRR